MKDNLSNIPELNLDKTEHFYVVGTKNRDGVLAGNYKVDLKKLSGGSSMQLEELTATENGEYIPDSGKAYSKVTVDVEGVSIDTFAQAFSNFEMYVIPENTGFFAQNSQILDNTNIDVYSEYNNHYEVPQSSERANLQDYIYVSNMDVLRCLVEIVKKAQEISSQHNYYINLGATEHVIASGANGSYSIRCSRSLIGGSEGVCIKFYDGGSSSTGYPYLNIWLDLEDITKFICH